MTTAPAYEQISEPVKEMSDQLLLEQLPQVKYIARRIHGRLPQHVPFDDLLHAGIVGLIDALHKFNPDKNVRFASYAKFRIRGAILDSLRDMDWSPRDLRRKARRLETTTQQLQTELGHSATQPELAQAMGMTLEDFQHLLDEIRGLEVGSLQVESLEDGRETDLGQTLPGPANLDPLFLCMQAEQRQDLAYAIAELPLREQQVLSLYYQEELTMKEVGAVLGVGESRVSQIHSMAVARLRACLKSAQPRRTAALAASSVSASHPASGNVENTVGLAASPQASISGALQAGEKQGPEWAMHGLRLLVADDSPLMRKVAVLALRQSGIAIAEVLEAGNGFQALDLLRQHKVDLVLSDMNMPVMDGLEFMRQLGSVENARGVPVLMITAEGGESDVMQAIGWGAAGYLRKPFTPAQMKQHVLPLLAKKDQGRFKDASCRCIATAAVHSAT